MDRNGVLTRDQACIFERTEHTLDPMSNGTPGDINLIVNRRREKITPMAGSVFLSNLVFNQESVKGSKGMGI